MAMKVTQMDQKNSTVFQLHQGVSWKEDNEVVFDDHTVLVFNHPEKSYLAAVTSPEDIEGTQKFELLHTFDSLNLPDLDDDVKAHMDVMDVQRYEQKQKELSIARDHVSHALQNQDRYVHPMVVVDTNYDEYLILYKCREEERMKQDGDDFFNEQERFRQMAEEYDAARHPLINAYYAQLYHGETERFQNF
jgi:hypothetical protein